MVVQIRADQALWGKELAPPRSWTKAVIADKALQVLRQKGGLEWMREGEQNTITVHALAMAKNAEIPKPDIFMVCGGQRVEHIPVARVVGTTWFCHPGSTIFGKVSKSNPFDPRHARMIDIVAQKYDEDARPRKRLRGRTQRNDLKKLATDSKDAFDQLVAISTWQAEHERAARSWRPMDTDIAEAGMERDPFQWGANKVINLLWTRRGDGDVIHANITPMNFNELCKEIVGISTTDVD